MKILLVGDYSNVHATLAEGLRALGHTVVVASDGDGWKDYPRDIDLKREGGGLRYYLRLWHKFRSFRGYDVVQIINPVFLPLKGERIYQYLRRHNKKIVMGAFGMDYYYIDACLDCETFRYSDFNFGQQIRHYPTADAFRVDWHEGAKGILNRRIAYDCDGIVCGLYEYWASYRRIKDYHGKTTFIPFPIKVQSAREPIVSPLTGVRKGGCTFFIGIQRGKEEYKGTDVMLRALERVAREYPERCRVVKVESVPFEEYVRLLYGSDVLLDQLYSYTPAMNALEAMARGIVVVSGGEPENYEVLDEKQLRPIVNVLPDEEYVYQKLCYLVENPDEVARLKHDSQEYIRRHHDYIKVAQRYEDFYKRL